MAAVEVGREALLYKAAAAKGREYNEILQFILEDHTRWFCLAESLARLRKTRKLCDLRFNFVLGVKC